jgi:hypothetical protein
MAQTGQNPGLTQLSLSKEWKEMPLKFVSGYEDVTSLSKTTLGVDYGTHLKTEPITGMASTSKIVSGKVIAESTPESQTLHPGVYTKGMSITVEGGRVINLGNYETARVGVTITVPCTKETLDEAYEYATEWVSEKIEEAVKAAKE